MKLILCIVLLCSSLLSARAATVKVFILAGQSNMEGQGFIARIRSATVVKARWNSS